MEETESLARLTSFVEALWKKYDSYHDSKERIIASVVGLEIAIFAWVVSAYGVHLTSASTFAGGSAVMAVLVVLSVFWGCLHQYLLVQLRFKRIAAIMSAATSNALQAWISLPPKGKQLKPYGSAELAQKILDHRRLWIDKSANWLGLNVKSPAIRQWLDVRILPSGTCFRSYFFISKENDRNESLDSLPRVLVDLEFAEVDRLFVESPERFVLLGSCAMYLLVLLSLASKLP